MNVLITLFFGFLIGVILRDVKERFGVDVFWIGLAIVTFLSIGAVAVYRNIL